MKMIYDVQSTKDKVYIHTRKGCVARLCNLSAEFYHEDQVTTIPNCSFEEFRQEAEKRGYIVRDKDKPEGIRRCTTKEK